ncbi:MAG: hypothetical protein GY769_03060 [bacterium]|nr:hypothetical protein [bacterium]
MKSSLASNRERPEARIVVVEPSKSTIKRLREILELLLRTMKTLSLYEARNPVSENLEKELHARLAQLLDEEGPLELKVLEHQILFGDEVVYENQERKESLAFLLSRDGIRSLSFRGGLELDELRRFVSCLNRARVLVGGEDDLATLLWDQDFESIDYFVIDELADGATGEEPGEGLVGTGWSTGSTGVAGAVGAGAATAASEAGEPGSSERDPTAAEAGGTVTLQDVRPSASLPVKSVQLSESEIQKLHDELAEESRADPASMAVELAVELAMLEADPEERQIVATALADILDERLAHGKPEEFLESFERLSELAGEVFAVEPAVTELFEQVHHAGAREEQLGRFLEAVDGHLELAERAQRFLAGLPEAALPTLIDSLGSLQLSRLRRAVSDAVLVHGERGPRDLMNRLPALRAGGEGEVIDELLHMVHHLPQDSAFPLVERLLSSGDSELARRGALILGHFRGEKVELLLLKLFERGAPETKSLAISGLARSGNRALAPRLLKQVMEPGNLKLDWEEIRRELAAIGRLGGDSILPDFDKLLQARSRVWFPTREKKELVRALVHGVSAVGSASSQAYLEQQAASGNRMLKGICREELTGANR